MIEEAIAAPAPVVVVPKSAPVTKNRRTVTKFRVDNPNLVPKEYLKVDEVKLGAVIRAMGSAAKIPGVTTWQETV